MSDRNFNDLADRFASNIYDSPKGEIRLRLVQDELLASCPALTAGQSLRILDAGCGMGQITVQLLNLGHTVVACDVSSAMLEQTRARAELQSNDKLANLQLVHTTVQELPFHIQGQFDLVVFHAVLEWTEEPEAALLSVLKWLKPGGTFSIMFYNLHSLIFKNLLRGNFSKIDKKEFRGDPGGLTPINPLNPDDVEQWLLKYGFSISSKRGIRCFYDFMDHSMKHKKLTIPVDEIIRMEKEYGVLEPYRSLGRYMLMHCKKMAD